MMVLFRVSRAHGVDNTLTGEGPFMMREEEGRGGRRMEEDGGGGGGRRVEGRR